MTAVRFTKNISLTLQRYRRGCALAQLSLVLSLSLTAVPVQARSPLTISQNTEGSTRDEVRYAGDSLVVTDIEGKLWLSISGPWPATAIRLPAGTYRVTARWNGHTATRDVTLDGAVGQDVYFHWKTPPLPRKSSTADR